MNQNDKGKFIVKWILPLLLVIYDVVIIYMVRGNIKLTEDMRLTAYLVCGVSLGFAVIFNNVQKII